MVTARAGLVIETGRAPIVLGYAAAIAHGQRERAAPTGMSGVAGLLEALGSPLWIAPDVGEVTAPVDVAKIAPLLEPGKPGFEVPLKEPDDRATRGRPGVALLLASLDAPSLDARRRGDGNVANVLLASASTGK